MHNISSWAATKIYFFIDDCRDINAFHYGLISRDVIQISHVTKSIWSWGTELALHAAHMCKSRDGLISPSHKCVASIYACFTLLPSSLSCSCFVWSHSQHWSSNCQYDFALIQCWQAVYPKQPIGHPTLKKWAIPLTCEPMIGFSLSSWPEN